MNPRVSVLMTIYNPGPFLAPAIESVLTQTFTNFELIAIENGSRDGARDVVRRYAAADRRIRLIELPENIGRVPALNRALDEARGEFAAILDADDVAHPERLALEVAALDARPNAVMVASHARYIDDGGAVIGAHTPPADPVQLHEALAYGNPFPHSSIMYRRAVALAAGGYCPRYPFGNDLAMSLALTARGEAAMIAKPLVDVRIHPANATVSPAMYFSRYYESIELWRQALARPGMSAEARRHGRVNLATTHFVLGRELWRARKFLPAAWQFVRMIAVDPLYCLRRAWVHAARRLAAQVGSDAKLSRRP
ncbi:MAG TPA: glycosyltransferase [Stellaceae bacterium]|nr:glycosyltransferase [Stellaceae bacterium]